MKFSKICLLSVNLCLLLTLTSGAQAMCGESVHKCYHQNGNKLIKKSSCEVTQCGFSGGGSTSFHFKSNKIYSEGKNDDDGTPARESVSVNGKPGFSIFKGNKSCYGANANKKELFCYSE